ncbi:unnamed protein product [Arctogadus glacialis]
MLNLLHRLVSLKHKARSTGRSGSSDLGILPANLLASLWSEHLLQTVHPVLSPSCWCAGLLEAANPKHAGRVLQQNMPALRRPAVTGNHAGLMCCTLKIHWGGRSFPLSCQLLWNQEVIRGSSGGHQGVIRGSTCPNHVVTPLHGVLEAGRRSLQP